MYLSRMYLHGFGLDVLESVSPAGALLPGSPVRRWWGLVTMGMLGANVGLHKTEIKSLEFINVNRLKSITNIGKHGPCSAAIAMKRFTKSSRRENAIWQSW